MNISPVVLFVYNRPWHTRQTVEALQKNELAQESELFIFSDGAKEEQDVVKVREVRDYLRTVDGFKSISIFEREENRGLADSIIDGVTQVVNKYGRVIVLEDDLVTSPFFLEFMNEALEIYKDENRVMHISGYMFPIKADSFDETFFIKPTTCWGWATWDTAWKYFEKDIDKLLSIFTPKMIRAFNIDGAYNYYSHMIMNKKGKINTWAIFWYASVFLHNGLSLHPKSSFVMNVGHDGSGVHCNRTDSFYVYPAQNPVSFFETKIEENQIVLERVKQYYHAIKPSLWQKITGKLNRYVGF